MRPSPRVFAICLALVLMPAALPVRAGMITGTSGVNNLGWFDGVVTYTPLTDTTALWQVVLTNTSPAGHGGYLTGFAFNNPGDRISGVILKSSPAGFELLGGSSFQNSVNAAPFGQFDVGAAVGGSFEGGGNPSHGLGVGQSGSFYFALTGKNLNEIGEDDFRTTPSAPPGDGQGNPAFVARFRGFDNDDGPTSDKVPLDPQGSYVENPEPSTLIIAGFGSLGIAGVMMLKRRRRGGTDAGQ